MTVCPSHIAGWATVVIRTGRLRGIPYDNGAAYQLEVTANGRIKKGLL